MKIREKKKKTTICMWFLVFIWWENNTKKTPLCMFRYIALGNVPIQCTRVCLFPLAIKSLSFTTPRPSFSLSTTFFLSLFFLPYLIGFPPSLSCIFALTSSSLPLPSYSLLSLEPSFVWNRADFTSRGFLNCAHV